MCVCGCECWCGCRVVFLCSRDPGVVGLLGRPYRAALLTEQDGHASLDGPPFFSLIADGGVHVHPAALALAFRTAPQRAVLVTDAMCATGLPPGEYTYGDMAVTVSPAGSNGFPASHVVLTGTRTLAGAVATLDTCVRTLASAVGPGEGPASVLATVTNNPATLLRLQHMVGRLAVGCLADLVLLDPMTLEVQATFVGGVPYAPPAPARPV
jgi:N-acetylgalactosamine-6-phosphate deacetylase